MKIIIIPDSHSPYSKLLIEALRANDLQVDAMNPQGLHSLFYSMRQYGKPDVVHIQWQHQLFTGTNYLVAAIKVCWFFLQWFILRISGVRFVWTIHNLVNHERIQVGLELNACRLFARMADALIVHCDAVKEAVAKTYQISEKRLSVIPHGGLGAWYTRAAPTLDRTSARVLLGIPDKSFIFLYFGYIRDYKGVDDLVETFARIDDPDLRLMVIGRPASSAMAERLSAFALSDERLMLTLRFIPDEELPSYITACNVVTLPYRDSLTSGTAHLATAYSRPLIAPRVGCLEEFPNEAGFLFSQHDPDGLINALKTAARMPLSDMEAAAYQFSQQHPWSDVASRTVEVYRSVVK